MKMFDVNGNELNPNFIITPSTMMTSETPSTMMTSAIGTTTETVTTHATPETTDTPRDLLKTIEIILSIAGPCSAIIFIIILIVKCCKDETCPAKVTPTRNESELRSVEAAAYATETVERVGGTVNALQTENCSYF